MTYRILGFVDGENLVHRYQKMVADGATPQHNVIHHRDEIVWHPALTTHGLSSYIRIAYYQTVTGDAKKINEVKQRISDVNYHFSVGDVDTYNKNFFHSHTGSLFPRIFKKEQRSQKTKSVDINLTIDMLRHASNEKSDVLYLYSGDGDFLPLVEELGQHGKQVWLAAFSNGLNQDLRYAADEFFNLDEIFFK